MTKFWTNASGSFRIDPEALHEFLKGNGYGILRSSDFEGSILIKVENRLVKLVNNKEIRDFCWRYLSDTYVFQDTEERKQVKNMFYRDRSFFSYDNLLLMPSVEINEILDTESTSFLFFKNCILKITANSIEKIQYDKIEGHVFEKDIIDIELAADEFFKTEGDFYEFIEDICSHENSQIRNNNVESLLTIIGYLLHRYKNPSNAKAIILMDPYRGDGANGGTGKSLFTKALEKVRPTVYEDGKFFHSKDRFALGQINYNTRILVIDDLPENFDFSKLFPLITEKAVVERKYQNKYTIHFERSPKIILTTNYSIKGSDRSTSRRKIDFVLSDSYSAEYTPETKFGRLLFIDWEKEEWERFYVLMAYCIWSYFCDGLIEPKFNVAERTLKMEVHPKFIEFMNSQIKVGIKYNKKEVYDQFYSQNPKIGRVEMNSFRRWLKLFADACGYKLNDSHSGNDNFFEYSKE